MGGAPRGRVRFRHALIWLLVGSLIYAVALAIALVLYPDPKDALAPLIGPSLYLTPLFGLPYLVASARLRGWGLRLLYFLLLLPIAHCIANALAWRNGVANFPLEPSDADYTAEMVTGAIGGFAGATLGCALLFSARLAPLTPATRATALLGIGALTALGAFGMAQGLALSHALELPFRPSRFVFWYECVHLPWQAGFALLLALLMRMPPDRGAKGVR